MVQFEHLKRNLDLVKKELIFNEKASSEALFNTNLKIDKLQKKMDDLYQTLKSTQRLGALFDDTYMLKFQLAQLGQVKVEFMQQ